MPCALPPVPCALPRLSGCLVGDGPGLVRGWSGTVRGQSLMLQAWSGPVQGWSGTVRDRFGTVRGLIISTSPNFFPLPHPSWHYILSPHPTSHSPIFFLWQFFQHDRLVVLVFPLSDRRLGGGGVSPIRKLFRFFSSALACERVIWLLTRI